jgi:hypothetical protein
MHVKGKMNGALIIVTSAMQQFLQCLGLGHIGLQHFMLFHKQFSIQLFVALIQRAGAEFSRRS